MDGPAPVMATVTAMAGAGAADFPAAILPGCLTIHIVLA